MNNKITDNEIIKALECCIACNCKECPCRRIIDGGTHCTEIDEEEILNLINRQRAEIERLKRRIGEQKHALFEQQAYTAELQNKITTAKSEAIKEFSLKWYKNLEMARSRLLEAPYLVKNAFEIASLITDNLAKEMVGDE